MANEHLYISKTVKEGETVTHVELLSEDERIREIARMASGDDVTKAALANAREMLLHARQKRQEF